MLLIKNTFNVELLVECEYSELKYEMEYEIKMEYVDKNDMHMMYIINMQEGVTSQFICIRH